MVRRDYSGCLSKYYDACKAVGATLILVGPIDRHNSRDNMTKQPIHRLQLWLNTVRRQNIMLILSKQPVLKKAAEFVKKAAAEKTSGDDVSDTTYAWADSVIAEGVTDKADSNVAFVDLNQPTLDWLGTVTKEATAKR